MIGLSAPFDGINACLKGKWKLANDFEKLSSNVLELKQE